MSVEIIPIFDQPDEQWGVVINRGNSPIDTTEETPSNIRNDVEEQIEKRVPDIKKEENPFDNPLMWKKSS